MDKISNNDQAIHHLNYEDKEIIIVGTAHVSKESAELVTTIIEDEKPDTVSVELCQSRYQSILDREKWQNMDIIKVIKEKKAFLLLSNLLLAAFQKRIADKLDIKPGQEMIMAVETANSVGSEIHLADREIRITLSKTWRIMGLWNKLKLFFQFLLSLGEVDEISEEEIENLKNQDVLQSLLSEVEKSHPILRDILIDERDQYLAEKIRTAPGKKIVAVVGAGHVPGIKKYWNSDISIEELESIPPKTKMAGLFKWGLPLLIMALFIYGFFHGGSEVGTHMIKWWFLANGVLAGIGAIIALAHPLTILAAILAAPLTSLNPMIAAGWVSGLVEAFLRKPRVKDFQNLQDDITSAKGFWKNAVTRILLVVVLTNVGSMIGTFAAIPLMMRFFG